MSEQKQADRVLVRSGARQLNAKELEMVGGGFLTHVCTFDFTTCTADGDCEQIPQCP
jgi:hypothetical protein